MGQEDGHGSLDKLKTKQLLTDPDEAADFIEKTKVDALAVAIGTSHGAYKFTKPPTKSVLAISHLKTLQQRLPDTHFVLHGSSSVPQDWLAVINAHGGDYKTNLWRASRGNNSRHKLWRAQSEY